MPPIGLGDGPLAGPHCWTSLPDLDGRPGVRDVYTAPRKGRTLSVRDRRDELKMDADAVRDLVAAGLDDCEVAVEGGGGKYQVTVVGDRFDGLLPVRRQQIVYATLAEVIADGRVHAVSIRALTPGQRDAQGR